MNDFARTGTARERRRIERVAGLVAEAKSKASEALMAWDSLPDVDASSGDLEQAVGLLGEVEGDLDSTIEEWPT